MGPRNKYFEGMEDGQMIPRGYRNSNSYVKNLRVLVFEADRRTDRQTETLIQGGFRNFLVPPS
jgi:hypothetical protein